MSTTAHMTELEAVNQMLLSIGEAPVSALGSALLEASIAETTLDNVNREIQALGWHCNTRRDVEYTPDDEANSEDAEHIDYEIEIASTVLKIDTVAPSTRHRNTAIGNPASHVHNASLRRDPTDEFWALYDVDNDTFAWSNVSTLNADVVTFTNFDHLTPMLQHYIFTVAAHRFQKGLVGATVLHQYTAEDVMEAKIRAEQEEAENEDLNVLYDNSAVQQGAFRRNRLWGS